MGSYAGIGSRQTPKQIIDMIKIIAILLAHDGHVCATGAEPGADQAFAEGTLLAEVRHGISVDGRQLQHTK